MKHVDTFGPLGPVADDEYREDPMHECDEIGSSHGHCSHGCEHEKDDDGSCRRETWRDSGDYPRRQSCHSIGECHCDDDEWILSHMAEEA